MARIDVSNGGFFELRNPNVDMREVERVAEESKNTIIRAASPFVNTIRFFNKTKKCAMYISFSDGVMLVTVTNPDDEIFSFDNNGNMNAAQTTK
jgi:hypothetical protein